MLFYSVRGICYHSRMTNNGKQASVERQRAGRIHTARRTSMYIVRTLMLIIMGCIVCIATFLTAVRLSNLYILVSEGMALRAECILADGAKNDLEEYFTLTFLESDPGMADDKYEHYTITDYNYDLAVEKISVLPWSMVATVTAVETVTVKGTINEDQLTAEQSDASDFPIPQWTPVRYRIRFLNNNGRWYISALDVVEENPETAPLGTPDPNLSPIPAATATPKPTQTILPTAAQ